ncbi:MFS transporter [Acetobacterium wieringae]|jgi:sugar (glycoside-pentoside-hexuronide) transporter|uniref:MFS transporter n=1 Tax=Acetobacterium wieringae TaxID=52694 RepID=A0A5D0WWM8_9FIRM|nr:MULTISPECIES: glycoside-pentoside-hexuronide (GPH):cation symporter [Acetobacterium]MEA4806337.1 glycoside-pentoside-hexuronide (GPH):cation symporter [Acetobacterium wieringae]TYC88148.1 MFS transporter [Acetobacterium wieringae]UYO61588.1 MFS transporter [Acetobacterium wieringae]
MNKPLKKSAINLYGLPSFGFQTMVNIEVMFFAAFLTDFAKIPLALVSTILLATSIVDIVAVPTSGVILEKSNMKWGKYRSWLLVGPPIAALFYILQFSQIGGTSEINAIIIFLGFAISHLVWNTFYAAHISMNNALTTVREERISMASNRGMFNAAGALVFSYFGVQAITAIGTGVGNPVLGYTYMAAITGLIMIACNIIYYVITKDYAQNGSEAQAGKPAEKMSVGEMLKQIVVNPPLMGLMLVELGRYLGRFVIFGMAFYYFKYVINDLPGLALFMTGLTIVNFFAAMIASPIAKRLGEKNTYMIALSLLIIGLLIVWFMPLEATAFKIIMFAAYIGYGLPDSLGVAMYSATVDYGDWKTGKNARGFIMSLISMPIKVSIFVRSVIISAVLASVGYVADMAVTPELIQGIKNGFALYPAIIMIIGMVMMFGLYTLTPKRMEEINKELAERKLA